jgi:phosphatidylserine/phosphatidylglycerophosphate/cardiolipin synthase-like enzyme
MPMDVASGATSLESLGALISAGVECRTLPERPRLHAKVYIFGSAYAVVTSANLTGSAFDSNIEAGVEIPAEHVAPLLAWFDKLWEIADPLDLKRLAELQSEARDLRTEYVKLKKKAKGLRRKLLVLA